MSRQTTFLPSVEAYDKWSETYDTDGNILQAVDTYALKSSLFSRLLKHLAADFTRIEQSVVSSSATQAEASSTGTTTALRITDLGCGTGRATITLLDSLSASSPSSTNGSLTSQAAAAQLLESLGGGARIHITGLDASPGMLAVARRRIPPETKLSFGGSSTHSVSVELREWDANAADTDLPPPAQAAMSTLVLEHLELPVFFAQLNKCLVTNGLAVVTNMHPDMGNVAPTSSSSGGGFSQANVQSLNSEENAQALNQEEMQYSAASVANVTGASFLDPATGHKIRVAVDYVHTIAAVRAAARDAGFEVIDGSNGIEQRMVQPWMLQHGQDSAGNETAPLLGERGKKWIGINVWFGMLLRKVGPLGSRRGVQKQ